MVENRVKYKRNPNFIFRKIVKEVILVPIHKDVADLNSIFTLNDVGAYLWELLENPVSSEELVSVVLDEYEGTERQISADVNRFLGDLETFGALEEA